MLHRRDYRLRLSFNALVDKEGDEKNWKPFVPGSFPPLEVLHDSIHYVNKKRKFQDDQAGHPGRKPKPGDLPCGSEEYRSAMELIQGETVDPARSQSESFQDSNSFVEEPQSAMSVDADSQDRPDHDLHGTSSDDHGNASNSNLYYLESRTAKRKLGDDAATFEIRRGNSKNQQVTDYEMNYADFMCSEYEIGDKEVLSELTTKEMMLYSNDISPHLNVLLSGTLGSHQEAQSIAPKPTIDQEFEQYFATLMLEGESHDI